MNKYKPDYSNQIAILRLVGFCFGILAAATLCLYMAYTTLYTGVFEIPRKFSSGPGLIVSPSRLPVLYYGFLIGYTAIGLALVAAPVVIAWRFWRATPYKRESMLMRHMPSPSKPPVRILRILMLFVMVPLIAIFIIMIAIVIKSS